jgi:protein phosphatase 1 regulatory subunit 7
MPNFIRIHNPAIIDRALIEQELSTGKEVILQFSDKIYTDRMLADIDELCAKHDEQLCIRFYGHDSKQFDCKNVLKLPNVKALYIDCMQRAKNINTLVQLLKLRSLGLGIYELRDTEILGSVNFANFKQLTLASTKTNKINLSYLSNYKHLESLTLGENTKNIEALSELSSLKYLSLHSIKKAPLAFINRLTQLKELHLILGGRENIWEIGENPIETLSIIQVRGFNDFSNLSNFSKLRSLRIENQIQLSGIHFDVPFSELSDLKLLNCKKLASITGLENLPSLSSLIIYGTAVDFDQFMQQELPKKLSYLGFYTGKVKVDAAIKSILAERGYHSIH